MYDLIIIGGGPAGTGAGVYAARKKLKTLLITEEFGGQSVVSADVQNWIGTPSISGHDLAKAFKEHLEAYKEDCLEIIEGEKVASLSKEERGFSVSTEGEKNFKARAVLVTTGARRKKLEVPGAEEFENKGVVYCASCDGPLFAGMDTVVVGGGNAGFESAAQLLAYAKSVTLLHRRDEFKADKITVEKVLKNPKMRAITNSEPVEIKGEKMVSGIVYKDTETNEIHELPAKGVFVEIGLLPNTEFLKEFLELDEYNRIVVDHRTQRAHLKSDSEKTATDAPLFAGVWAAGDVTNGPYHQNNIACGDAVKALEDIYLYLAAH
ncbi:MAG: FAD-dependent oxidoreductase [Candidatus Paceibacterota bacterium]